jgi:hypothetical protein
MLNLPRHGWIRTLVEATGLSAVCFLLVLIFGGNGPGEAAVAAVAAAGSPNPSGSTPMHAEIGGLVSAFKASIQARLRQESGASQRTAA